MESQVGGLVLIDLSRWHPTWAKSIKDHLLMVELQSYSIRFWYMKLSINTIYKVQVMKSG